MNPAARTLPNPISAARMRQACRRRRGRGVTLVEYIALLTFVVVPSIAAAIACFSAGYVWYASFVRDVSQSTP